MFRLLTSLFVVTVTACGTASLPAQTESTRSSTARTLNVEHFGAGTTLPLMILLHGVNGPSDFYRDQASFFARNGYRVLLPHYLEAGHGLAPTDANYVAWVAAVQKVIDAAQERATSPTVLVGYSLGASVALALGSQNQQLSAIAEFYGSLPDRYFRDFKGMPPLLILHGEQDSNIPVNNALQLAQLCSRAKLTCDVHIYPKEGHGFSSEILDDADQRTLRFFTPLITSHLE